MHAVVEVTSLASQSGSVLHRCRRIRRDPPAGSEHSGSGLGSSSATCSPYIDKSY